MELPNPIEVHKDFSRAIEDLDFFVDFVSTKESLKFIEFHRHLHSIDMEVIRIWHQINLLTITDKKYEKAFEKLRKILLKLLVEWRDVEKKHVKDNLFLWESTFREGKPRKDLIKFFKKISKQMKKIQKGI